MRVDNVIKNSYFAMIAQTVTIIFKAVTQIVFVRTLNAEYLGINGLFSNILTMLSLTELGVGSAILYNMYAPVAKNDTSRIKSLMNFYKNTYFKIGILVMLIGCGLTPFLEFLIKDQPNIPNLRLIYILYVLNNAVSYFFVYKQSIFIATQHSYVVMKINLVKTILLNGFQIILLIVTKAFMPYLMISIIMTIVFNMITSYIADKGHPYLKEPHIELSKEEKKAIYKDVYAMMAHKVGGVIVTGTDNMLLSTFVGIVSVGLYSNYLLVISSVKGFLNQIYDAVVSSIGDLVNKEDGEKIYKTYKQLLFISFWVTGWFCIGFSCLVNIFIEITFGKDYLLDIPIVWLIALNFYITDLSGIRAITNKFKAAQGLFWNDRYKSYFESAINLIASILFLKLWGFIGVLLGTLLSTLTTCFWVEPYVLYKYGFRRRLSEYFKLFFKYFMSVMIAWIISFMITMKLSGFSGLVMGVIICLFVPNLLFWLIYRKTDEFQGMLAVIKRAVGKAILRK